MVNGLIRKIGLVSMHRLDNFISCVFPDGCIEKSTASWQQKSCSKQKEEEVYFLLLLLIFQLCAAC